MLKLEEEPQSYDKFFTKLTKGRNQEVFDWITKKITVSQESKKILDVGCGPGTLALTLAQHGNDVLGIDGNINMIEHADAQLRNLVQPPKGSLKYEVGSANRLPGEPESLDCLTTTFMLSELRPLRQLQFLQQAWQLLKHDGVLYLAEEFEPQGGINRVKFAIKRWWYQTKLRKNRTDVTHPLKWLVNAFSTGFKILDSREWDGGVIRVYALKKNGDQNPLSYRPTSINPSDWRAYMTDLRCILTGQIDHVAIEPGIYTVGNPTPESPVIVTANYALTYHRVARALEGRDYWILAVDSNGINVWCAARGGEFGNAQIMEATSVTGIANLINHNFLTLPQLAAGGVGIPDFPSSYPFKIRFGPVWIEDFPKFEQIPKKDRPRKMHLAEFTFRKRFEAGITHTTFLYRKIFFWPSVIAMPFLIGFMGLAGLSLLSQIWGWILGINLLIAIGLPLTYFSRKFNVRGAMLAGIGLLCGLGVYFPFELHWLAFLSIISFIAWLTFFSTMSFSGYTMDTSYREITAEFSLFRRINRGLFLISTLFFVLYIVTLIIGGMN
jgi:ubiquinone/menaquinone biosynthesis C-methylase UbiE